MRKAENFQGKQDQMMQQYHDAEIGGALPQGGLVQFDVIVLITYAERELQDPGTQVCDKDRSCCVDPPRIAEDINAPAQQEGQEDEQALIGIKRKKQDEEDIGIRVHVTQKINVVQQQHL